LRFPPEPTLRGPRYVRCTVYLHGRLALHLKRHAESESWQLADLARGMIIAGLTFRHIYDSEKERSLERFVTATGALKFIGPVRRRYSPRGLGRGEWVTIHLPLGFLKQVAMWARSHRRSRNDALSLLLQDGLLLYVTAYKRFQEPAIETRNHRAAAGSQNQGPGDKESSVTSGS
jgi:hypothetical protein